MSRACAWCVAFVAVATLCAVSDAGAKERDAMIQLDETVISGNQELPKVLYIVPWQRQGDLPDIEVRHDFTEADVFRSLYPPAYRRELYYFEALRAGYPRGEDREN